jgi:hypothetical protein
MVVTRGSERHQTNRCVSMYMTLYAGNDALAEEVVDSLLTFSPTIFFVILLPTPIIPALSVLPYAQITVLRSLSG